MFIAIRVIKDSHLVGNSRKATNCEYSNSPNRHLKLVLQALCEKLSGLGVELIVNAKSAEVDAKFAKRRKK